LTWQAQVPAGSSLTDSVIRVEATSGDAAGGYSTNAVWLPRTGFRDCTFTNFTDMGAATNRTRYYRLRSSLLNP
jgi:hypothetical protein